MLKKLFFSIVSSVTLVVTTTLALQAVVAGDRPSSEAGDVIMLPGNNATQNNVKNSKKQLLGGLHYLPEVIQTQEDGEPAVCRFFYSDHANSRKYDVQQLHLYQLLRPVDAHLKKTIKDLGSKGESLEGLDSLFKASAMCSQVLTSMERLVFLFNTKAYDAISQFKWQFLSVCQTLKEHETNIKPRHVRQLAPRLKKFHAAIFNYYYTHKEFMDTQEIELFNEINRFCSGLRFCILPGADEYFDFSFGDLFTDALIFKPVEWAADHKLLVAAGITVIGLGLWFWHQHKKEKQKNIISLDPRIEICPEKSIRQEGAQCGPYAIVNALVLNAKNPEHVLQQAAGLNMPGIFAQVRQELARAGEVDRLQRFPESPEWRFPHEVMNIMQEPVFMNGLTQALGVELDNQAPVIVIQGLPSQIPLPSSDYKPLYQSVTAFTHQGRPQTVICYEGDVTKPNGRGHWVAMRLEPAAGKVRARICDSLVPDPKGSISSAQNNQYLRGVMNLYAGDSMLAPKIYKGLNSIQDANTVYAFSGKADIETKANKSFTDYTIGLAKIYQCDPTKFANSTDAIYKLCANQFDDCRKRAITNKQQSIKLPVEAIGGKLVPPGGSRALVELNIERVKDFSAYLAWFAQQAAPVQSQSLM